MQNDVNHMDNNNNNNNNDNNNNNNNKFLLSSMKKWKTELTSCGQQLGVGNIKRGIFQGDSLSPLLFVLCMVPLSLVMRRSK